MKRRCNQLLWLRRLACASLAGVRTAEAAASRAPATGSGPSPRRSSRQMSGRAFTLIELLVSIGVLVAAIFALAAIFDISSETTGRTVAHAELLEISAAVQQRITSQLAKIQPGLLIIDSPAPTNARAEIPGGRPLSRLRQDRLVFLALGGPGEFQSFTDPMQGTPADPSKQRASSSEALVYFGPGIPLDDTGHQPRSLDNLTASEWVLAHRAILLLPSDPGHAGWAPPSMSAITSLLNGGTLTAAASGAFYQGRMDAVVSGPGPTDVATGSTIIAAINAKNTADLLTATPSIAGLWDANLTPTTASLDTPPPAGPTDYYAYTGFTLQPRLADFRIEWTDGRTNDGVPDFGTRWFGLRPDWSDPTAAKQKPQCRHDAPYAADATTDELGAFQNKIEWSNPSTGLAAPDAAYRAIWRTDVWDYRPKALRFTYRIYDAGNRLKQTTYVDLNEDGVRDSNQLVTRLGQEFSFVVPVP